MAQMVDATVPHLGIQVGKGGFGIHLPEILPSLLEHVIHYILAGIFVRDETESIVIQGSIVLLVELFEAICLCEFAEHFSFHVIKSISAAKIVINQS